MKLKVVFPFHTAGDPWNVKIASTEIVFPDDAIVEGYEIRTKTKNNIIGEFPIVVMPFFYHTDSKGLHTICRRIPETEIDEIEV